MSADTFPTSLSLCEFRGRMGFARTDVSPPAGIYARLWGSATHDIADGQQRPMLAQCMVLQSALSASELVLITIDAVALWQEEADRIRQAIQQRYGLAAAQLMLHPSHTHSSPMLARRHADRPGGHLIAPYLDALPQICCDLVAAARAEAFAGILGWNYGTCALAFNRDAIDPPSGRGVCGLNLERRADDTLLVGRAADESGRTRAVLVNYACHPVSLGGANRLLSPDYVGPMRELIEREIGVPCLFLHGASGDLTPRRSYEAGTEAAEQNGRELGYAALSCLGAMLPPGQSLSYRGIEESGTALGIWRTAPKAAVSTMLEAESVPLRLPLKEFPSRDTIVARLQSAKEPYERERLERMLAMKERLGDETMGTLPVTVWRVGEAFLVATSGEPYSRFQVALRARFPHIAVAVMNLTNGATSYLPEASAYQLDVYPVRVTEYAAGCLEQTIEQATAIMQRLASDRPVQRAAGSGAALMA
ncbi:MAG: hypothetical protein WA446_14605 [Steroidobacteraceae bacterium]